MSVTENEYYQREIAYKFTAEIIQELTRARKLFPSSYNSVIGLMEEVGELAQAILKVEAGKMDEICIRKEAIQVCVMAMRVALEGDASVKSEGANRENM